MGVVGEMGGWVTAEGFLLGFFGEGWKYSKIVYGCTTLWFTENH